MTTPEADEQTTSAPDEAPGQQPPPIAVSSPPPEAPSAESEPSPFPEVASSEGTVAMPIVTPPAASSTARDVTYVPLAVTIGDGFKFGCGFFLAFVVALLIGFVLLAALFVLTGLFGLTLPIGR